MIECGLTRWAQVRSSHGGEDGRAIIEVVFLSVLLLVPLIYALIAILSLQSATFAVTQAARDVGRLIETSTHLPSEQAATSIATVALDDQRVSTTDIAIRIVAPGDDCLVGPQVPVTRNPGSSYNACVIATVTLPGIPTVLAGSNNTVTGSYTVVMSELREGR